MTKTVLVFPGQGSQKSGMLSDAPETESLDRLLDAAEALSGLELRAIEESGDAEGLADTRVAQPLLYLADWAWGTALIEAGIEPDAVSGHSLGELAALAIAGVYSVEAGLELVVERSRLMATAAEASPGSMAAVLGLDRATIASAITSVEGVWVANDNAIGQVVISGTRGGVTEASALLSDAGARRVVPLNVAGPFHSPLMESARDSFANVLIGAEFQDADFDVIQNVEPSPTRDAEIIRQRLMQQITSPVRWTETLALFAQNPPVLMVEAGPGNVLTGLARKVDGITALSADASGIEAVLQEVSS